MGKEDRKKSAPPPPVRKTKKDEEPIQDNRPLFEGRGATSFDRFLNEPFLPKAAKAVGELASFNASFPSASNIGAQASVMAGKTSADTVSGAPLMGTRAAPRDAASEKNYTLPSGAVGGGTRQDIYPAPKDDSALRAQGFDRSGWGGNWVWNPRGSEAKPQPAPEPISWTREQLPSHIYRALNTSSTFQTTPENFSSSAGKSYDALNKTPISPMGRPANGLLTGATSINAPDAFDSRRFDLKSSGGQYIANDADFKSITTPSPTMLYSKPTEGGDLAETRKAERVITQRVKGGTIKMTEDQKSVWDASTKRVNAEKSAAATRQEQFQTGLARMREAGKMESEKAAAKSTENYNRFVEDSARAKFEDSYKAFEDKRARGYGGKDEFRNAMNALGKAEEFRMRREGSWNSDLQFGRKGFEAKLDGEVKGALKKGPMGQYSPAYYDSIPNSPISRTSARNWARDRGMQTASPSAEGYISPKNARKAMQKSSRVQRPQDAPAPQVRALNSPALSPFGMSMFKGDVFNPVFSPSYGDQDKPFRLGYGADWRLA